MPGTNGDKKLRVLVLEPYYGGSHKYFLDTLSKLPFHFEYLTMPARKWKWRMRLSAPYYAKKLSAVKRSYDRILCSTYVDVAALRGLGPKWIKGIPLLTYFHENQFAYPVQIEDERDMHFAVTNMTTALSSDSVAFNSYYNLRSFQEGVSFITKVSPDLRLDDPCKEIEMRSRILYPPVDFSFVDAEKETATGDVPIILWNHRWEYEKNPELFFQALYQLVDEGVKFGLILLGGDFDRCPEVFERARKRLADRIIFAGYIAERKTYAQWLRMVTVVVSTSLNEFFGIAMLESVRAGCVPLLPERLAYPELFPEEYLYSEEDFIERLRELLLRGQRLSSETAIELTEPYSLKERMHDFEEWFLNCQRITG